MSSVCIFCENNFTPSPQKLGARACQQCVNDLDKRLSRYHVKSGEFIALYLEQKRCCAICGNEEELFVDVHEKKIRGLLCVRCLSGLRVFQGTDLLWKATKYLVRKRKAANEKLRCVRCRREMLIYDLCKKCQQQIVTAGIDLAEAKKILLPDLPDNSKTPVSSL